MLVLFGHQSVGQNLLDGISEVGREGVPVPALLAIDEPERPADPVTIRSFRVGQNRDPLAKFEHFSEIASGEPGRCATVAMLKLCYVDIQQQRIVGSVLNLYARMLRRIEAARPGMIIAHVTVPLRAVNFGAVACAARFFGRHDPEADANAARHAYNELLRERYAATGLLFDLAAVESKAGETRSCSIRSRTGPVPALEPAYTSDGGHLNGTGRRVVAKEFLAFLDRLRLRRGMP